MIDEREGLPSASEMHRVMACPGYLEAKREFPALERQDDGSAESGNKVHEAMEYIVDGQTVSLTLSEREEYITDGCRKLQLGISAQYIGEGEIKQWQEQRWFMTADTTKIATSKPDLIQLNVTTGTMLIADYKSGPKAVAPAADNWQLATAAACVYEDSEIMMPVKKLFGVIIQPLVTMQPRVVEMSPKQVHAIRVQIQRQIERIKLPGQPRTAGSHCAWCPVSHACPEAQFVGPITVKKFHDLGYLSPAQLVELNALVPQIRNRCDEIQAYIKAILAAKPEALPGLVLNEQSGGHEVDASNVRAFIKAVDPYLTKDRVAALMSLGVGAARDEYMDAYQKQHGCNKKEARAVWDDRVVPVMKEKEKRKVIGIAKEQLQLTP